MRGVASLAVRWKTLFFAAHGLSRPRRTPPPGSRAPPAPARVPASDVEDSIDALSRS